MTEMFIYVIAMMFHYKDKKVVAFMVLLVSVVAVETFLLIIVYMGIYTPMCYCHCDDFMITFLKPMDRGGRRKMRGLKYNPYNEGMWCKMDENKDEEICHPDVTLR